MSNLWFPGKAIYQRIDTQQYVCIEHKLPQNDDDEYYFYWHYISEQEANEHFRDFAMLRIMSGLL